jgi:hypothetical protein
VGIVVSGSLMVKNHSGGDLINPKVLFKATEGHVIGFSEGENFGGITMNPLTWITCHGKQTEILWLSKNQFQLLWDE